MEQPRKLYIVGFNEDEDSIHNGVNMIKFEYQSVNYPSAEWKLLVCFGEYNWVLSSSGLPYIWNCKKYTNKLTHRYSKIHK